MAEPFDFDMQEENFGRMEESLDSDTTETNLGNPLYKDNATYDTGAKKII
jgi:hypothetical protein